MTENEEKKSCKRLRKTKICSVKAKDKEVVNFRSVDKKAFMWSTLTDDRSKKSLFCHAYAVLFYDFEFLLDKGESGIAEAN